MKTTFIALLLAVLTTFSVVAQETLKVDVTKLSQQELLVYQKMKQHANEASLTLESLTPDKINTYAEVGRAFGSAFKECWTTVSTDAERFANSSAGKWAMVLVSWKIMGKDATQLVRDTVKVAVGVSLLTVGVPFFIYIFRRNCVSVPKLKSSSKIFWFTYKREYEGLTNPIHGDEGAILYGICFVVFVIMCCLIMFA